MAGQGIPIKKIDLYNENFDHYFIERLNSITPEQRSLIPNDLNFKIFNRGENSSAERLSFQEKMWILSVVFKKNVTIMVDDEKDGICMKEFGKAQQAQKGKIINGQLLDPLRVHGAFIIADRELMAASLYMNHVCTTNIYSLVKEVIKGTNHKTNQTFVKAKKEVNTILAMLVNYEANKKRITIDYKISMPQWYALIYFALGEKLARDFCNRDFLYAYASNRVTMYNDMKKLEDSGYLLRRGVKGQYKYSLTAAGYNILQRILDNIVLKF